MKKLLVFLILVTSQKIKCQVLITPDSMGEIRLGMSYESLLSKLDTVFSRDSNWLYCQYKGADLYITLESNSANNVTASPRVTSIESSSQLICTEYGIKIGDKVERLILKAKDYYLTISPPVGRLKIAPYLKAIYLPASSIAELKKRENDANGIVFVIDNDTISNSKIMANLDELDN